MRILTFALVVYMTPLTLTCIYYIEIKVLCLFVYVMFDKLNFKSSVTHRGNVMHV